MKFGLCLPIRRDSSLDFNIKLAIRAEELGFDSIWASDHVALSESQVGRFSKIFYDPFVMLSAIASKTQNIMLGTSLIILPYRNPLVIAKSVSTIDVLSSGRFIFGVGTCWLEEEFNSLGVPFEERGKRSDEYLEVMINLWEESDPEYEGDFINYSNIKFYPKPHQNPYPQIWIGGNSKKAMQRAAIYGNAWQPTWITPGEMKKPISYINNLLESYGRESNNFTFSVRNRVMIGKKSSDKPECYFKGTIENVFNDISKYDSVGVSHVVFDPETGSDQETFDMMQNISENIISKFK